MSRDLLSVLVVDDELPLRQELRLFPWETYGFELAGEAENGEEALHFCRNFAPDVVITDITMPVMDGMLLFRALKEEHPAAQVILLTCHSEFAYAREAIQLGAVEYLVKVTMDEKDLERALQKAKEALHREQSLRRNEAEQRRWELSRELACRAKESGPAEDLAAYLQQTCGLALPLRLTALHVEAKKDDRLLVKREVEETLSRLERPHSLFTWLPAKDGVYVLLFAEDTQNAAMLRAKLETVTSALHETIDERLPFLSDALRLYAVISEPVRQAGDFGEVCRSVVREHPQRFYDATSGVFIAGTGAGATAVLTESAAAEIMEAIRGTKREREKLIACLRSELPRWAAKHRIDPDALRSWAADARREWLPDHGGIAMPTATVKALAEARTIGELVAALVHEAESAAGAKRKERKEIADAKAYIDAHLDRPITLVIVAEHVGLSPHYLSRLFREETGISFNDYITKQRMEQAVRLLRSTSMRVYEVASAVGIPSYRYFTATFREYTGVAPTEYKKG